MRFFANPEFLWLLPLAAVVVWWGVRRSRPAMRFSDASLFAGPRGGRAWRAVWGSAILRGLACLALVLACAGPRLPDERTRLPAEAVAIAMIVDVSGSMNEPMPWPTGEQITRLEAAKRAFKFFVAGGDAPDGTTFEPHPSDQIGLIELAAVPDTVRSLTVNHSELLTTLDTLTTKGGIDAGTNIGDALALAVIRLEKVRGPNTKLVILLSDGEHVQSKDEGLKPLQAAQLAANLKYKVYTIDAGPPPAINAPPDDPRRVGQETLRKVAELTEGRYFTATGGADMLDAYKEIDRLERAQVETFQYRRYFEFYWWCSSATLVLLLTAHTLDRTRWRVVP